MSREPRTELDIPVTQPGTDLLVQFVRVARLTLNPSGLRAVDETGRQLQRELQKLVARYESGER